DHGRQGVAGELSEVRAARGVRVPGNPERRRVAAATFPSFLVRAPRFLVSSQAWTGTQGPGTDQELRAKNRAVITPRPAGRQSALCEPLRNNRRTAAGPVYSLAHPRVRTANVGLGKRAGYD